MAKAKWATISESDVRHVWKCDEAACSSKSTAVISPTFYEENGTPLCDCGEDMKYKRTEVRLPGAGIAKAAASLAQTLIAKAAADLAQALEDVMASEGGEPSPNPASRRAWRAAEKALKAWRKSIS